MSRTSGPGLPVSDIGRLKEAGETRSLIRLLNSTDPRIQWQAAEALGTCGKMAVPLLLEALRSPSVPVRLGVTEALGMIRDPDALSPLVTVLDHDRSLEVRWAAVIALGEMGSAEAVPSVVPVLREPDRYLRFGAAITLGRLGWEPGDTAENAYLLIARQDWEQVRKLGAAAIPYLHELSRDRDPATREAIASVLGQIGDRHAQAACRNALRDRDPRVRWRAVLASMNCGLPSHDLPLMVAGRERTGPDPAAAALLNFLFLGIGYNYLGKWWGFPVFMTYMSVLVLAQLALGPFLPYLIAYPVTAVLGIHTYYLAERMSDF
ncbi:MAG TPA: HEAT repeat domain-containing protein [Methanoregula sp.]|nr:HEAT repeat domain-containing protein [Methanoregula sp.]